MSTLNVDYAPTGTGMSKIPRYQPKPHPLPPLETNNGSAALRPSRLQQLQSNYQQKILKEKEEKLVNMYEENQKKALQKVHSKGSMRNFFKQRREMEQNGNIQHAPTMNNHYKMVRQVPSQNGGTFSPNARQNSGSSVNSMGRDRSNLLAPIDRNVPVPQKPQRHGRPKTKDSVVEKKALQMNGNVKTTPTVSRTGSYRSQKSPMEETPPPNMTNLKNIKNQKMNRYGKPPSGKPQQAKMSDFEKWQTEQDQARENRLKAHRQETSGYEYEPSEEEDENDENYAQDDIARKQRELMEQIAKQQAELERIRVEREQEEIEEKKEMERRRKREEERRRRLKEEEERRRKEDEERRIQEEEEHQQKLAEMSKTSQRNSRKVKQQYQEEDPYSHHYEENTYRKDSTAEQYQPTPPPKPKPKAVRVQRKQPPKHPAPAERTSSPQFTTNNISMYENAAMDSDAYAGGSVKLVSCSNCGRKFAADRLQRHKNACGNVTKKRKVMDPTKMRVAGTDMEKYTDNRHRSKTPPKKGDWRKKRENFIQAMRYAKKCADLEKKGGDIRDLTPPPPSENPDYKQCPYCSRKFNPDAAARHIPRCKDLNTRPPPARKGRR